MSWIEEVNKIPKNLIAILKGLSNSFRIQILEKILEENQISLSKIQKFTQKPNSYILNHIHKLEIAGLLQNYIKKSTINREYSFYSMTEFGILIFSCIKNEISNTFRNSLISDKKSILILKAISNPFRFALLDSLANKSKLSFTELISLTNEMNTVIANHLHKLELGQLIQNFYQKKESNSDYSYYEITDFGKNMINAIKESYNKYYQLKISDRQIPKSDPKQKSQISFEYQISSWVLPNESILGWVKISSIDISKIEFNISKNISFKEFFNINIDRTELKTANTNKTLLIDSILDRKIKYIPFELLSLKPSDIIHADKEYLQIIAYNSLNEVIQQENANIELIIPEVKIEAINNTIKNDSGFIELRIQASKGIEILNLNIKIRVTDEDGLEIPIKTENKNPEDIPLDIPPELRFTNLIGNLKLNGSGPFLIQFHANYVDVNQNEYNVESNVIKIEKVITLNHNLNCNYNFIENSVTA